MLAKIAAAHEEWSLRYGDTVPYVAEDAAPHGGRSTDLPVWQADRSAPAEADDELMAALQQILADGYDEDEPLPEIPAD